MMAAKASLAEAKVKLREAVLAQRPILRNTIEQTKALEASLQQALQTSRASRSISTAPRSAIRNWRGKPKPIVRCTKASFAR